MSITTHEDFFDPLPPSCEFSEKNIPPEASTLSTESYEPTDDEIAASLDVERIPPSLVTSLESSGVTSHRHFDQVEKQRWERGQAMSDKLVGFEDTEEKGRKMRMCHSFWTVRRCNGCRVTQKFWNRCDLNICPQCAPRIAKNRLESLEWLIDQMDQPKHLVLTFKNVPVLTKGYVEKCKKIFSKFRRLKLFSRVIGGFYALEVKWSESGWHLHIHTMMDSGFIAQSVISSAWHYLTNGESYVTWIESASKGKMKEKLPKYVAAYTFKGNEPWVWPDEILRQFVLAFDGVRTFGTFGSFYKRRAELKKFLADIKELRSKCECGCREFRYFSELEWFMETELALPPPARKKPHDFQAAFDFEFSSIVNHIAALRK